MNTITSTTKLDALRTFIRTLDIDILFLQEVENEQLSLPGFNVIANVDHARRGTAIALKTHIHFSNVEKSLDGRLVTLRVQGTTLCCVYAPSGTALRAQRERFFNNTLAYYLRHRTNHVILAGDFNCVLRQCDATGYNISPALQTSKQTTKSSRCVGQTTVEGPRAHLHNSKLLISSGSYLRKRRSARPTEKYLYTCLLILRSFSNLISYMLTPPRPATRPWLLVTPSTSPHQ